MSLISRLLLNVFLVFSVFFNFATVALGQSQLEPLKLTSEQDAQLHDLLVKVLRHTNKSGCGKSSCKILVMNFTDSKGNTSNFGMRLAQRISYDGVFPVNGAQTVSYDDLRTYLSKERIATDLLADPMAESWLARELSANAALVGHISTDGSKLKIELQLIGAKNGGPKSLKESAVLAYLADPAELAPAEPYGAMPDLVFKGEKIPKLVVSSKDEKLKMTVPRCTYKPDPPYTEAARQAKAQGTIVLQTVISKEGRMLDVRPMVGAPYGLNHISVDTVRTWKCNPATQDGLPITVLVPVEVSFRLY